MKAYLINTDNMKAVGRFASIKSAEKAGAGAKYNFDIVPEDDDMARFTKAEMVTLFNNHRGTRVEVKRFSDKSNGAKRIHEALTEAEFKVTVTKRGTGVVARVWEIASELKTKNADLQRKDVIQACVMAGINPSTAATQYQKWRVNESNKTA